MLYSHAHEYKWKKSVCWHQVQSHKLSVHRLEKCDKSKKKQNEKILKFKISQTFLCCNMINV